MKYMLEVKRGFKFMGAIILEGERIQAEKLRHRTLDGHMDLYAINLGLGREFVINTDEIQWASDCDEGERFKFVGVEF